MTISASQTGKLLTITNDSPVRSVTVDEGFLELGHRGIGSWVKRQLGLEANGQYDTTAALVAAIKYQVIPAIVPDVVGLTQVAAESRLLDVNLIKGTVTNSTDPVVSQDPVAGTSVDQGSAVDLTMTV